MAHFQTNRKRFRDRADAASDSRPPRKLAHVSARASSRVVDGANGMDGADGQQPDMRQPCDIATWLTRCFLRASPDCARLVLSYLELVTEILPIARLASCVDYNGNQLTETGFEIRTNARRMSVWAYGNKKAWSAHVPRMISPNPRFDERIRAQTIVVLGDLSKRAIHRTGSLDAANDTFKSAIVNVDVELPTDHGSLLLRFSHDPSICWQETMTISNGLVDERGLPYSTCVGACLTSTCVNASLPCAWVTKRS